MVERKAWGLKSSLFRAAVIRFTKGCPNWRCLPALIMGERKTPGWSVMLTMADVFSDFPGGAVGSGQY
jgi:hypothetical protein